MTDKNYARACTEVLEILSYFPEEEYLRIPTDKIELLKQYRDEGYDYSINPEIDLSEQYISKEAKAMIVEIYREYFATEHQKSVIDDILKHNQMLIEKEKENDYYNKYGKNDLLINKVETIPKKVNEINFEIENETVKTEQSLIECKETFLVKLKRFIFKIFHIKEK